MIESYIIRIFIIVVLINTCIAINLIIKVIRLLHKLDDYYSERFTSIDRKCNNIEVDLDFIKDDLTDNTNSILDNIAELNGMISISAGKICKILDIVDAKDKAYIKATDTCKSDQSIKTRKAKNSSHSKKVTTIHCNKNIAK